MMTNRLVLVSTFCLALCIPATSLEAQSNTSSATRSATNSFQQLVLDIQRMLTELGYRPGPVDGAMGDRTRQAIRRYQSNTGLPVDGHPSESLRQHLRVTTGNAAPAGASTGSVTAQPAQPSGRKAAWHGQTVSDALLRVAPSDSSVSRQRLVKGTAVAVIRRQGAWLEVRVESGGAEGWVKQVSVRAAETAAAPSKTESGGFFANLARGVSRLLGGASEAPQNQGSVTVGIRGLAPEDLASAVPDPSELDKMESFRADRDQAYRFASEEKLTAQTVEYIPDPDAAAPGAGQSGGRD